MDIIENKPVTPSAKGGDEEKMLKMKVDPTMYMKIQGEGKNVTLISRVFRRHFDEIRAERTDSSATGKQGGPKSLPSETTERCGFALRRMVRRVPSSCGRAPLYRRQQIFPLQIRLLFA